MKKILEFLQDIDGANSSKRLAAILLIACGICAKLCLIWYGAKVRLLSSFTLYESVDTSINPLLWTGAAILTGTVVERFKKK